jgi:hypothetical protein
LQPSRKPTPSWPTETKLSWETLSPASDQCKSSSA